MSSVTDFAERFNLFLYRQHVLKLEPAERETAREWCLQFIRREHPKLTDEEVDRFYENLINVKFNSVDEWTRRMS